MKKWKYLLKPKIKFNKNDEKYEPKVT